MYLERWWTRALVQSDRNRHAGCDASCAVEFELGVRVAQHRHLSTDLPQSLSDTLGTHFGLNASGLADPGETCGPDAWTQIVASLFKSCMNVDLEASDG
jgi:hypothetical protein